MAPYKLYEFLLEDEYKFILKADYLPEIKSLGLEVICVDGVYDYYLGLDRMVPVPYEDMVNHLIVGVPFMKIIDTDLVFKHADQ